MFALNSCCDLRHQQKLPPTRGLSHEPAFLLYKAFNKLMFLWIKSANLIRKTTSTTVLPKSLIKAIWEITIELNKKILQFTKLQHAVD